jgi:GntP family gluconate:H+ symporter
MFPLSPEMLLVLVLVAIVGLVVLIARFRWNAFVALLVTSLFVGLGAGMEPLKVVKSFETGLGNTLAALGMIIGLGTILGKMLAESGGAEVIARTIVGVMGVSRLDYAVMLVAFLVGISVFFGVGIMLLGPIAFTLARETRTPILRLALPMAAGLSTAHGLIPPHPGPMAAIATLHADTGKTILWSVIFGLPTALVTGPLLARWVAPRVPVEFGGLGAEAVPAADSKGASGPARKPSFGVALFTMLLPVVLMLVATVADLALAPKTTAPIASTAPAAQTAQAAGAATSPAPLAPAVPTTLDHVRQWADFIGAPTVAMLIAVIFSFVTFGYRCGFDSKEILKFSEQCVGPAASIFLVIGAGGGFTEILKQSGVGNAISAFAQHAFGGAQGTPSPMLVLVLGWTIAGMLRIAVGSATVAVTTAAGLMLPIVQLPGMRVNPELLVLAMGAGSLILSHVNDSGFWFVKEYLGMSVSQTLRTWTIVETGIAVTSLVLILLASLIV